MRTILVLFFVSMCVLNASDAVPVGKAPLLDPNQPEGRIADERTDPPPHFFIVEPIELITSYFDYMPGSYISTPIQIQDNGGVYLTFHGTETSSSTRRQYITYIAADGTWNTPTYLSQDDIWEGYGSMDLDPETQDPMFAWHLDFDQDGLYEVAFGYDAFHLMGGPGLLSLPLYLIDDGGDYQPYPDDEFIWPYVFVTNAPTYETDGKRRVFVFTNNATTHEENPTENVLVSWCDFETFDIETGNFPNLTWNHFTYPLLDAYNSDNGVWGRYQKSIAVTEDGKMAMFGYLAADDVDHDGSDYLIFYNDNYGEGEWQTFQFDATTYVDNPLNQDGTPFFDATDIYYDFVNSGHPHALFDIAGNLHFIGNYVLGHQNENDEHMLWQYFSHVKHVSWNPNTNETSMYDLYPQGEYPWDGEVYLAWDEDADGQVDQYDADGFVMSNLAWPIGWYGWDEAFHENNFKLAMNPDNGYMVAVWQDGTKAKFYNEAGDEEYVEWQSAPEIMISCSRDAGLSWSDPIRLNSVETPELAGMIPNYVYPGDVLEDMGEDHMKLHLFFYNDSSYGPFQYQQGSNDGGTLQYAALDIDFSVLIGDADENQVPSPNLNLSNYPNPFNPQTTIAFELPATGNVELNIYNLKGQKIKSLHTGVLDTGSHQIVWNGNDDNGKTMPSGIYLCRLTTPQTHKTIRLLMLK